MTLSELKAILAANPENPVSINLPDGNSVPPHFHVTEVAFSKKDFIDCGGTIRHEGKCLLQIWVADDIEHRVNSSTLAKILEHGAPVIPTDELPVEIEYCLPGLTHMELTEVKPNEGVLNLILSHRQTDCLAKDVCGISPSGDSCEPGSGCC
ncbi:MAG: DUF6428 family protein [Roseibacillus sp.]